MPPLSCCWGSFPRLARLCRCLFLVVAFALSSHSERRVRALLGARAIKRGIPPCYAIAMPPLSYCLGFFLLPSWPQVSPPKESRQHRAAPRPAPPPHSLVSKSNESRKSYRS